MDPTNLTPKEAVIILTLLIIAIITIPTIIFGSWYTVPAGHEGVLTTFGKVDLTPKPEGFGFKIPIAQKVTDISIQTQKYEVPASASSKDLQIVTATVALNYQLQKGQTPTIYQNLGLNYQSRIIAPAVQEVIKASTAQFTAEELITKRPMVNENIKQKLQERLITRGIIVEEISLTDFQFSSSFNEAIEAKVTAEQLKLKADRDLQRIIIEKEQKITEAQAEAEALRLQKQEVTAELIELRRIEVQRVAIEKWDGKLPKVTGGANPFINIDSIASE